MEGSRGLVGVKELKKVRVSIKHKKSPTIEF